SLGVCCAKLGEAEALAGADVSPILITSPVIGPAGAARLAALAARSEGLIAAVDHPRGVEALAAAGARLDLVVDIDPGIHRTGVAHPASALALAQKIKATPGLSWAGLQFYCGMEQHIGPYAERREAIVDRTSYFKELIETFVGAGLQPRIVTGGGTGSSAIDLELGVFTELQVGAYVFMDRQYGECELAPDASRPFETALMVDSRVISRNHAALATVDAGFKAFATDAGAPTVLSGAAAGSKYRFMGDEHGCVIPPEHAAPPELGEVVAFAAPHCDPTVNLYDAYHVVEGDTLVDIWPIEARGRSA
ncbi:MAG: alanine racemase, partial [Caulobacteraceae bacterium]